MKTVFLKNGAQWSETEVGVVSEYLARGTGGSTYVAELLRLEAREIGSDFVPRFTATTSGDLKQDLTVVLKSIRHAYDPALQHFIDAWFPTFREVCVFLNPAPRPVCFNSFVSTWTLTNRSFAVNYLATETAMFRVICWVYTRIRSKAGTHAALAPWRALPLSELAHHVMLAAGCLRDLIAPHRPASPGSPGFKPSACAFEHYFLRCLLLALFQIKAAADPV